MRRNKIYSGITIFGLSVGLAACLVVMSYVRQELSYDRFHKSAERIFRLTEKRTLPEQTSHSAKANIVTMAKMSGLFPEIDDTVRIIPMGCTVEAEGREFYEIPYFADPSILNVFDFPLVAGDHATVLANPHNIVISEEYAKKFFSESDPLGKILTVNGRHDFRVSGLMRDVPTNSHLRFGLLCPFARLEEIFEDERDYNRGYVYLLLREGTTSADLEAKINSEADRVLGPTRAGIYSYHLQPLTSIHLQSRLRVEISQNNRPGTLVFLSGVSLLILFLACINFVTLSTARAIRRAKEVGVRKTAGASRMNLVSQFLGESSLSSFLALALAVPLAHSILPLFNSLANQSLRFRWAADWPLLVAFLILGIVVGLAAGVYPAFVLSSFSPQAALKGSLTESSSGATAFSKALLALQFAITIAFVVASITIFRQMSFVRERDLGFDSQNIVHLYHTFTGPLQNYPLLRNEILRDPAVLDVTGSDSNSPGFYAGFEALFRVPGKSGQPVELFASQVAENFLSFFQIPIVEGRDFIATDTANPGTAMIVNRTAARLLGPGSPVGKSLESDRYGRSGTVVGVVDDFHNVSLYEEIKPAVLICFPRMSYGLFVKIRPGAGTAAVEKAREAMASFNPEFPVVSFFLDDQINDQYREDNRAFQVIQTAFGLSLLVASLGLLGLVTYAVERRTKEIGIRKVLGASLPRIIRNLTGEYLVIIMAASTLAWPLSYYFLSHWLRNFAYRIDIGGWIFILSTGFAVVAAILVMAIPAVRAAQANPVESLRYE